MMSSSNAVAVLNSESPSPERAALDIERPVRALEPDPESQSRGEATARALGNAVLDALLLSSAVPDEELPPPLHPIIAKRSKAATAHHNGPYACL